MPIRNYRINMRQAFSKADIGKNKADVLVSRCNRFFGTQWMSIPENFRSNVHDKNANANFTVTCVDSVRSRKEIYEELSSLSHLGFVYLYNKPVYWMDIGNSARSGQVILGTLMRSKQPPKSGGAIKLKTFFDEFKDAKDDNNEPSCSLAESLFKQDLFVNKMMATYAADILWKLLYKFVIDYRGVYVNLDTLKSLPIPI